MFETLKEFAVKLSAVVDNKSFDDVSAKMDETASSISGFASTAIGALTAGAFAMAIRDTADRFNGLADAASRMGGITTTELDRIGYIADHTGSSSDAAAASLENLSKMIGEAGNGIGGGAELFKKYGLSVKNADGSIKSVTQVLDDLKGKMGKFSQSQKAAMLQQFGMDKTLVDMMSTDTQAIADEYNKRTQLLGVNADEVGALSADFNDNLGKMTRSFSDVMTAVVVRILPPITDAFKQVTKWVTYSGDTIAKIIEPFTAVIRAMVRIVNGAIIGFTSLVDLFGGLPAYIGLAAAAWKAFNMLMSASPLVKFITVASAVISVIGLLIDDFRIAREGGESFFKFWNQPWFDNFLKAGDGVVNFFKSFQNVVLSFGGSISGLIVGIFTGDFDLLKKQGQAFFDAFKGMWQGFSDFVWGIFDGLAGALEYAFKTFFPDAHAMISQFGDAMSSVADTVLNGITGFFDRGLQAITDKVTGWIGGIAGKISGAFDGVKSFFGFGDDEKKEVKPEKARANEVEDATRAIDAVEAIPYELGTSAAAMPVAPTPANQSVTNNINNQVSQTFNVRSREEAGFLAQKTPRLMGGAA